jgi:hypothetical protein
MSILVRMRAIRVCVFAKVNTKIHLSLPPHPTDLRLMVLTIRKEEHLDLAPFVHVPTAETVVALGKVDLTQKHRKHARDILHLLH